MQYGNNQVLINNGQINKEKAPSDTYSDTIKPNEASLPTAGDTGSHADTSEEPDRQLDESADKLENKQLKDHNAELTQAKGLLERTMEDLTDTNKLNELSIHRTQADNIKTRRHHRTTQADNPNAGRNYQEFEEKT